MAFVQSSHWPVTLGLLAFFSAAANAEPQTYVGKLPTRTGDAKLAIVVEGDSFVAYSCGERSAFNQNYSRWWKGSVESAAAGLEQAGVKLMFEKSGAQLVGKITGNNQQLDFQIAAVPTNSAAGLYRGEKTFRDRDYVLGWIVDLKGKIVGSCSCKQTGIRTALPTVRRLAPAKGNAESSAKKEKKDVPAKPKRPAEEPREEPAEPVENAKDSDDASEGLSAAVAVDDDEEVKPAKVKSPKQLPAGKRIAKHQKDTSAEEDESPAESKKVKTKAAKKSLRTPPAGEEESASDKTPASDDDPADDGVGEKPAKAESAKKAGGKKPPVDDE